MTVFLLVWNLHCTRVRFTVVVPCSDELAVHSCPLLFLQMWVAKVASGLFYCCFLLRNNNMATNLQRFTLYYGGRRFAAWDCWTQTSWQVMQRDSDHADSGKPYAFILSETKHEWVYSNVSISLKNPLLVRVWPMCLRVILHLCRILFMRYNTTSFVTVEYIYAGLWEYVLIVKV